MYEKNCLTHVTISQIEKPYTIVLQNNSASTIQWKQVVKKVYDIEPKCTAPIKGKKCFSSSRFMGTRSISNNQRTMYNVCLHLKTFKL